MNNWATAKLEDCLDSLLDYRGKSPKKAPTGIPVLSAKVVKTDGLKKPIEQTIAAEYYSEWMVRGLPAVGDVVMTTEAPLGEVIQLDDESVSYALGQRIVCMRGKEGVLDSTFLRYALVSPQQQANLAASATGTTVLGISQKALRRIEVSFPDLPEQLRIGGLLSSLDDKIELNRRVNETLEEMARALFRDWFVDFGPTRRQMEGATDPAAIMGGAVPSEKAAELAPLFPAKLGEEGLPQGWGWATVGALTEKVTKGTTPRKADLSSATNDETVPFYRVVNLSKCGQLLQNSVQKVPLDVHIGALKRSVLQANDILYSIAGTIGRVCKLEQRDVPANLNQALAIVRPDNSRTTANYLLLALRYPAFQDELHSNIVQAVQANLSLGMISSAPMLTLAIDDLRQIMEPIDLLLSKHDANEQENQTLAEMRDLLLPKLMSGEIRLKDAEGAV